MRKIGVLGQKDFIAVVKWRSFLIFSGEGEDGREFGDKGHGWEMLRQCTFGEGRPRAA